MKSIKIHLLTLALVIGSMSVIPAYANKANLASATIPNGYTSAWYPTSNPYGYSILKGTTVKLHFVLSSSETNVYYGLEDGYDSSDKTQFAQFGGTSSSSASMSMETGGTYKPYVTNYTAGSITVKDSSYIEF